MHSTRSWQWFTNSCHSSCSSSFLLHQAHSSRNMHHLRLVFNQIRLAWHFDHISGLILVHALLGKFVPHYYMTTQILVSLIPFHQQFLLILWSQLIDFISLIWSGSLMGRLNHISNFFNSCFDFLHLVHIYIPVGVAHGEAAMIIGMFHVAKWDYRVSSARFKFSLAALVCITLIY